MLKEHNQNQSIKHCQSKIYSTIWNLADDIYTEINVKKERRNTGDEIYSSVKTF